MFRWHTLVLMILAIKYTDGNIFLPTLTIDTKSQPNVIDIFRLVTFDNNADDQKSLMNLHLDQDENTERMSNIQLQHLESHFTSLECLYLVSFSSQPTPMQRTALGLVIGGESHVLKSLSEHSYLVWSSRSNIASAAVSIDRLVWSGKYLSRYKYTPTLLEDLVIPGAFTIAIQVVPFTDLHLFSKNLLTQSLSKSSTIFGKVRIVDRIHITLSLMTTSIQTRYKIVKHIAMFCEVVEINSLRHQPGERHVAGRTSLLRSLIISNNLQRIRRTHHF